jgi:hypothetical protein
MRYLRIVLKICEGCGSLWYRAQDCPDVYCPGCSIKMRKLPQGQRSRRPGRRGRHGIAHNAGGAA